MRRDPDWLPEEIEGSVQLRCISSNCSIILSYGEDNGAPRFTAVAFGLRIILGGIVIHIQSHNCSSYLRGGTWFLQRAMPSTGIYFIEQTTHPPGFTPVPVESSARPCPNNHLQSSHQPRRSPARYSDLHACVSLWSSCVPLVLIPNATDAYISLPEVTIQHLSICSCPPIPYHNHFVYSRFYL